jgi:hypothetical protein
MVVSRFPFFASFLTHRFKAHFRRFEFFGKSSSDLPFSLTASRAFFTVVIFAIAFPPF